MLKALGFKFFNSLKVHHIRTFGFKLTLLQPAPPYVEEGMLRGLFPGEYDAYARRTPTYIPFIARAIPLVHSRSDKPARE